MDWMPQAIRDGVIVVLVISGPLVLAAAFIGLAIGILQAATQVQEQTIGSALKIVGVFALIIILGFWMFQYLTQYTNKTLTTAFTFIPRQSQKVVPKDTPDELIFQGKETSKSFPQIPKLESEKLELDLPKGTPPPGAPILGRPNQPPPSPIIEAQPPDTPKIPELPLIAMPKLPLSDFQEPVAPQAPYEMLENEELLNVSPQNSDEKDETLWNRDRVITKFNSDLKKKHRNNISWVE
ncbi:MAG: flagellar biosynthetic protein FliQ [Candidatus Melainabacteria bacterium]|nr:flagellar biosynthetic protein FliQ [Candidatus Melainabacteria bacterium]